MIPMGNSNSFRQDFSQWCFENFDVKFAGSQTKQSFIDPHLIFGFLKYAGYLYVGKNLIDDLRKFVLYILSNRSGQPDRVKTNDGAKRGELKIWLNMPRNITVIEGEGSPSPIIDICDFRPLFHIQRGHILILKNLRILFRGNSSGILLEALGPSFFYDPEDVQIMPVEKCNNRPDEGYFVLRHPIWIGDPQRNPYEKKKKVAR